MIRYCILVCVGVVSGCSLLLIGENVVSISGEVEGDCLLSLIPNDAEIIHNFYTRDVSGKFNEGFTVLSRSDIYKVTVSCNGTLVYSTVINYPEEMDKFNLGVISLSG